MDFNVETTGPCNSDLYSKSLELSKKLMDITMTFSLSDTCISIYAELELKNSMIKKREKIIQKIDQELCK